MSGRGAGTIWTAVATATDGSPDRVHVEVHLDSAALRAGLVRDVMRGLTGTPRSLPPRYFYDAAGSALFDEITRLPEYYPTRVERDIIESIADDVHDRVRPVEIVELGAGSPSKVRRLLDSSGGASGLARYVPVDVDVQATARAIAQAYADLQVVGVVGDFEQHLAHLPSPIGRRLIVFFGSTIGNLDPPPRGEFLVSVRRLMAHGDRLLLGVDLVKDRTTLEAAYNDSAQVTSEFNRNILRVVNRGVDADFRPEAFRHLAFYDQAQSRIEMHLVPESRQHVVLRDLGIALTLTPDESIWTESSYKFTRESVSAMLDEAGLHPDRWYTDADAMFALALADRV